MKKKKKIFSRREIRETDIEGTQTHPLGIQKDFPFYPSSYEYAKKHKAQHGRFEGSVQGSVKINKIQYIRTTKMSSFFLKRRELEKNQRIRKNKIEKTLSTR